MQTGRCTAISRNGDSSCTICAKIFGCAGEHVAFVQIIGFAGEIADQAAGLGDQQRAGRDVPGLQAFLEEAVDAAGGDIGQVQRGGAGAAQAGGISRS